MGYIDIAELGSRGHDDIIGCRGMREEDVKDPQEKMVVPFTESQNKETTGLG